MYVCIFLQILKLYLFNEDNLSYSKKIIMSPKWKIKFDISNIVLNSQRDNSRWCIVYKHHWPHSILLPNLFWVSECDSLENGNYL